MTDDSFVWVFNGSGSFPGGVFTTRDLAEAWIRKYGLKGTLTAYPLDVGVYDWVIEKSYFTPKHAYQTAPEFIGQFSSACQQHYHYSGETGGSSHPNEISGPQDDLKDERAR